METSHEWCLKAGSVFGLIPFNIFISDKNDGIKSNVSKFTLAKLVLFGKLMKTKAVVRKIL